MMFDACILAIQEYCNDYNTVRLNDREEKQG